jgi:hypothetical protein
LGHFWPNVGEFFDRIPRKSRLFPPPKLQYKILFSLEMQKDKQEWQEVANIVDSLAYTVKNLEDESIYKFRVRAENIHGRSEPSLPSEEIIVLKPKPENGDHHETNDKQKQIEIKPGGEFRERFDILEELGKGRFGVVHRCVEKESSIGLAAKIIKCIKAKDRVKVQEEIKIMKSLQHPKLLQLLASFETAKEIVMVME